MSKIIVGMSGGIDSTTAAAILKSEGHEIIGMTLKLWDGASRCCDYDDIMDAKKACWKLGIKHYVINAKREFKKQVVNYFISDYLKGKTPNPCVICNERIKFRFLIKKMKEIGFDYVATGHYARTEEEDGKYCLKKGADSKKSQEYFLSMVKSKDLKYIKFPLGEITKEEVKRIARDMGFDVSKKESQEVCFLQDKETPYEFIFKNMDSQKIEKGAFYSIEEEKLGDIDEAYFKYTIGQRKGLRYAAGRPLYVVEIDAEKKRVIIGEKEKAYTKSFTIENINLFCGDYINRKFEAEVKIRYKSKPCMAKIILSGNRGKIEFHEPQFAVTPGQLCVFYKNDYVLGSGFILKNENKLAKT